MTPAAVLSILVQTKGVGAAQAQLTALDRSARNAGDGLHATAGQSSKTGRALSALKGTAGLVAGAAGIGGLVVAGKAMSSEYREAQKTTAQTNAVLKSTGGVANVTRAGVEKLAGAISAKAGIDDEAVQSGANLLLTFKNVRNETGAGRDIFNQATRAAVDLSAAGFGSLSSTSKQLGKALNDPVKGMTALGRAGVTFSADQKKAIEALMATGKESDRVRAQQLILREVMSQVGGSAAAQATASDKFRVALGNLAEVGGRLLIPVLDKAVVVLTAFMNQMLEGRGAGGMLVKAFELVGGAVAVLVTGIAGLVGWFKQHETVTLALAAATGVLLTAFAGFKILAAVQAGLVAVRVAMLALNAAFLTNPVVLVVAALAALAAGFVVAYRESEAFRRAVDDLAATFRSIADAAHPVTSRVFPAVAGAAKDVAGVFRGLARTLRLLFSGDIKGAFEALKGTVRSALSYVVNLVRAATAPMRAAGAALGRALMGGIKGALSAVSDIGRGIANALIGMLNTAIPNKIPLPGLPDIDLPDNPIPKFARGGAIPGAGNRDSVPALLMPGEHVLTRDEVRAAGGHRGVFALRRALGGGGQSAGLGFAAGGKVGNARTILSVGRRMGASDKVLLAAIEAALVESNLVNVNYGDRDSLGLFQQRPSQGWGSPAQVTNPTYAATQFFKRAIPLAGRYGSAGQLAQAVQRSAFPGRYDERRAEALEIIAQLGGGRKATTRRAQARRGLRGFKMTGKAGTVPKSTAPATTGLRSLGLLGDRFDTDYLRATLTPDPRDDYTQAFKAWQWSLGRVRDLSKLAAVDPGKYGDEFQQAIGLRDTWQTRTNEAMLALPTSLGGGGGLTADSGGSSTGGMSQEQRDQVLTDIRDQLALQNKRAAVIGATEGGVLAQAITAVVTGQIGGKAFLAMQSPGSTGNLARY